jgi:DNA processing protein
MASESVPEHVSSGAMQLLTLLQLPRVGPAAVRKLAWMLKDNRDASVLEALRFVLGTRLEEIDRALPLATNKAQRIADECVARNIFIVSLLDEAYPAPLSKIADAPPVVYVRGSLSALTAVGCAVVGTRQASETGLRIARKIASVLAERKFSTVSGLALGIDAAAHTGALDKHGVTVAVLAHGLHTITPTTNKKIGEQILEQGGALISEHEPGVPPRPAEFVRRNRIQSGMSVCSIIVESGREGGAIHQTRFTKDQGRLVLAVMPDTSNCKAVDFNSEGAKYLVESLGASPLRTAEELEGRLSLFRAAAPAATQSQFSMGL